MGLEPGFEKAWVANGMSGLVVRSWNYGKKLI